MKRGEVWTAAGGRDYAGKPRPVVIIQDDAFQSTGSVIVCALTTNPLPAPLFRLPIEPSHENGLHAPCQLMVDKITALPRSKLGQHIGVLDARDMRRLNWALILMLGLAIPAEETSNP